MSGDFKRLIYIIGTIIIVFLVGSIILHILPWLLLIGLVIYIVTKIVGLIKGRTKKTKLNDFNNNKGDEHISTDTFDDYTNGEIIDVEYEDIDKRDNK